MKNMFLVAMMALVSISGTAFAQQRTGPKGHGFLRGRFQSLSLSDDSVDHVCVNAGVALFKNDTAGIRKYFNPVSGWETEKKREVIRAYVASKKQRSYMSNDDMVAFFEGLRFKTVYADYWKSHLSGYIMENQNGIHRWNPTKSSKYPRKHWRIAYDPSMGVGVDMFVAHCLNFDYIMGSTVDQRVTPTGSDQDDGEDLDTEDVPTTTVLAEQSGSNNNQIIVTGDGNIINVNPTPEKPKSVVMIPPHEELPPPVIKKGLPAIAWVGIGAAGAFVIYEVIHCITKSHHDNVYNNNFGYQGGSGSTTTQGGQGGSQTW